MKLEILGQPFEGTDVAAETIKSLAVENSRLRLDNARLRDRNRKLTEAVNAAKGPLATVGGWRGTWRSKHVSRRLSAALDRSLAAIQRASR